MNRHAARLCATAILGLVPAIAAAQGAGDPAGASGERRPYRGIFAPPGDGERSQSLVFNGSVFSGWDDNVVSALTGSRGGSDRRLQGSGVYSGAATGLTYRLNPTAGRVQFSASSTALASYYYTDKWNMVPHYAGGAHMSAPLGGGFTLGAGYSVAYAKNYRFVLFPDSLGADDDGALAGDPDNELFRRSTLRHSGDISLSKKLDSRSSISAGYSARYIDFVNDDSAPYRRQTASLNFDRRMTAHATMNLGYGYTTGNAGPEDDPRRVHHINAGVNYSRALSFSRRTSLGFSTGSGYLDRQDATAGDTSLRSRLRFVGSAVLTHEMGRTWTASAAYARRFIFREGFTAPFFSDGVTAQIAGLVTRRMDVSAQASWSLSKYQGSSGGDHRGAWAVAQVRYGLTSWLASYARYVYYDYRFSEEIRLDPDFPAMTERQGVRVGLAVSVPLM